MMNYKNFLLAGLCLVFFNACKKDNDTPKTPQIPKTTGSLSGKVDHYDQFGTLYTNGLNTTTVSIEGKEFKTVTNISGHYSLSDVPSGNYNLIFEKPGCGIIKRQIHFNFTDTVTYNSGVSDIPVFTISDAYVKDTTWFGGTLGGIYYNANTSSVNNKATIVAIIGNTPGVDISNPSSYINYATASVASATDFNRFLSYSLLRDTYNQPKNTTLYLKIYPVSTAAAYYLDNKLAKPVYTSYGTVFPTIFEFLVK